MHQKAIIEKLEKQSNQLNSQSTEMDLLRKAKQVSDDEVSRLKTLLA